MLKLLRIDDRLIHGQVAFSWLNATGAKQIIVASDKYALNPMLKMSLTIGKPPGVDLKILELTKAAECLKQGNSEKTMLIVENIQDAYAMCELYSEIADVCIGGVRDGENKKYVYRQVYLNSQEMELIEKMMAMGKNVFAQDVPISSKATGDELKNKFKGG